MGQQLKRAALITFILLFLPVWVFAQDSYSKFNDLLISAKYANRSSDILDLQGNVQLIFRGNHLAADRAVVNTTTKIFHATGAVVLQNESAKIEGQELVWNYDQNTGTIYNGYIESGQIYFEGEVIEKTGKNSYVASHGDFTGCKTCPPAWNFAGNRISAELGGYAHIRSATFRAGDFPIFWLPYLVVPIKTKRQSGLLPPGYEYQNGSGNIYSDSFFWAISDNQDATFTEKYYQFRGLKSQAEYRYVLSPDSNGYLNAATLKDRFVHNDVRNFLGTDPDPDGRGIDRWFVNYHHYYELPDNFVQKANLNLTSDLLYTRDFVTELPGEGDPALENRISLSKDSNWQHWSIDTDYYINLLQQNPLGVNSDPVRNPDSVERFPTIRYSITDIPIADTPMIFSFNAQYDNFVRQGPGFDTVAEPDSAPPTSAPNYDNNCIAPPKIPGMPIVYPTKCIPAQEYGTFFPGRDIVRTGQRLNMAPKIAYPLHAGHFIDILPSVTYNHTQYAFNVDPNAGADFNQTPMRDYVRTDVSAQVEFSRVYGDLADSKATRYKHSFQPEFFVSSIPWLSQTNSPFFGSNVSIPAYADENPITNDDFFGINSLTHTPLDTPGIQFDYNDRIYDRDVAGINLKNFLTRKKWQVGGADYMQIADFELSEMYDFDEAKKPKNVGRPWSDIRSLLDLRLDNFNTNTFVQYFPYHRVTNIDSRVTMNEGSKSIQLGYSEYYNITDVIPADPSSRTEALSLLGGWNTRYFNISAGTQFDLVHKDYLSWLGQLDIIPPGNCLILHFLLAQPAIATGAAPTFNFSFNFNFDGKT